MAQSSGKGMMGTASVPFVPANKELYERSNKPFMTIAMGIKPTRNAMLCWRDQVRKEQQIKETWRRSFDPTARERVRETAFRVVARDCARKAEYLSTSEMKQYRRDTGEVSNQWCEEAADDLRAGLAPGCSKPGSHCEAGSISGKAAAGSLTARGGSSDLFYEQLAARVSAMAPSQPPLRGGKPAASASNRSAATPLPRLPFAALDVDSAKHQAEASEAGEECCNPRQKYLRARSKYSPQEKLSMPNTTYARIGWAWLSPAGSTRADGGGSIGTLPPTERRVQAARPARRFKRHDDEEHARLLGYDFNEK